MKSIIYIVLLFMIVLSVVSCKKEDSCRSYECKTIYTAYGRGVERTDTSGCMTATEVKEYEASRYISNDSIFQQTICK